MPDFFKDPRLFFGRALAHYMAAEPWKVRQTLRQGRRKVEVRVSRDRVQYRGGAVFFLGGFRRISRRHYFEHFALNGERTGSLSKLLAGMQKFADGYIFHRMNVQQFPAMSPCEG